MLCGSERENLALLLQPKRRDALRVVQSAEQQLVERQTQNANDAEDRARARDARHAPAVDLSWFSRTACALSQAESHAPGGAPDREAQHASRREDPRSRGDRIEECQRSPVVHRERADPRDDEEARRIASDHADDRANHGGAPATPRATSLIARLVASSTTDLGLRGAGDAGSAS